MYLIFTEVIKNNGHFETGSEWSFFKTSQTGLLWSGQSYLFPHFDPLSFFISLAIPFLKTPVSINLLVYPLLVIFIVYLISFIDLIFSVPM